MGTYVHELLLFEGAGEENESLIGEEFICLFDSAFVGGCSEATQPQSSYCCGGIACLVQPDFPPSKIRNVCTIAYALEKSNLRNLNVAAVLGNFDSKLVNSLLFHWLAFWIPTVVWRFVETRENMTGDYRLLTVEATHTGCVILHCDKIMTHQPEVILLIQQ